MVDEQIKQHVPGGVHKKPRTKGALSAALTVATELVKTCGNFNGLRGTDDLACRQAGGAVRSFCEQAVEDDQLICIEMKLGVLGGLAVDRVEEHPPPFKMH